MNIKITNGKFEKVIDTIERVETGLHVQLKVRRCYEKTGVHDFFVHTLGKLMVDIRDGKIKICECEQCKATLKGK